jgi:hypothetical protein
VHELHAIDDVPPLVPFERRHRPDRRGSWRGGRRATDWTCRPIGAWRQFEQVVSGWRQWLGKVHAPMVLHRGSRWRVAHQSTAHTSAGS